MHRLVSCCQLTLSSVHETLVPWDLSTSVHRARSTPMVLRRECLNILFSEYTHPDHSLLGVKIIASMLLLSDAEDIGAWCVGRYTG